MFNFRIGVQTSVTMPSFLVRYHLRIPRARSLWAKVLAEGNAALDSEALVLAGKQRLHLLKEFLGEVKDLNRKLLPTLTEAQQSAFRPLASKNWKADIKDLQKTGEDTASALATDLEEAVASLDAWLNSRGEDTFANASSWLKAAWAAGTPLIVKTCEQLVDLESRFASTSASLLIISYYHMI